MEIRHVGVVGAGTMGNGIAQVCATAGLRVTMVDIADAALQRGMAALTAGLSRMANNGGLSEVAQRAALARITATTSYNALRDVDLVIEATTENAELKLRILRQLDEIVGEQAIVATNTSSISITLLAAVLNRPDRFIGLHFFNPAPVMSLLEVVRGLQTSDETHARALTFARAVGKMPVDVRNSPGFVVNRVLIPMINEAIFVLQEGLSTAEGIDTAMKQGCNHPIGPLALADMIGLDVVLAVMRVMYDSLNDPKYRPAPLLVEMVDAGRLGRKTGLGFHSYDSGARAHTHIVATPAPSRDPLVGITVIDLSHLYNGPYATFLMAMAGAKVIKVEPLDGEHLRIRGEIGGASLPFAMLNSNKQPVSLNLKTEQGRVLLREMVARADVVVENFAPGVMERLGLGAEELRKTNPRLIYASSSGYGKDGPYRDHPAMDLLMQAMCGVMESTGYQDQPPVKSGAALCDFLAGTHLYGAIATALYERGQTGVGRVVEVSMQDATYMSMASSLGMLHPHGAEAPPRAGNRHGAMGLAPYNVYRASDGYVVLSAPSDGHFRAILEVIGASDLKGHPSFATRAARVEHYVPVDELIEGWTRKHPKDEVIRLMLAAKVPCAPVRQLSEVMVDDNMHARGSLLWIDHPELGRVVLPHSPLVFEGTRRRPIEPSLPLGASNDQILGQWLGHTENELARYRFEGVIL